MEDLQRCTTSLCSGSALLKDVLGVIRSMERDILSVLSIYPKIFLRLFIVTRLLLRILLALSYSTTYVSCFFSRQ